MGWQSDKHPGHEGYAVGIVKVERDNGWSDYRELGRDDHEQRVDEVQIACECGWRSERMLAPFGTRFRPQMVVFPREAFEDRVGELWRQLHLDHLAGAYGLMTDHRGQRERAEARERGE